MQKLIAENAALLEAKVTAEKAAATVSSQVNCISLKCHFLIVKHYVLRYNFSQFLSINKLPTVTTLGQITQNCLELSDEDLYKPDVLLCT